MAAVVEINRVAFGGAQYDLASKVNEKAHHSTAKQVHNFAASAYGAYRFTQLPGKIAAVAAEAATLAEAAVDVIQPIKDVAKVFNTAANGMIWGYWLWSTFEIDEQISKVVDEGSGERWLELGRRCIDWVTAACHSLSSLMPNSRSTLGKVSLVTDLTNDIIESGQAAANWCRADEFLSQRANLSEDVQEGLKSEKILHLISLIKSVIAITAGVFGVLGLFFGMAIVPSIVLLTMGLATCSLAFVKHFFKENMPMYISRERVNPLPV